MRYRFLYGSACSLLMLAGTGAAAQSLPEQAGTVPPTGPAAGSEAGMPAAGTETAAADADAGADTIVVTGFRQSLRSAQGIKRNADQIVDAIVAQDIGKLPDINVSDSLARITGVQVDRRNGEAQQVRIRGLPQFTTTYNGREIFTAEQRVVATQDFPAGGVAALEVFKSSTANLVEPGLAGLINVRSRRPFDFDGLEIAGAFNTTLATQSQSLDWNGNLLVSNRWDTGIGEVGALVNVSYTRLRYLDSARFDSGAIATASPEQSAQAPFRFPDAVGFFQSPGYRQRPSVNAAVQWKPTDNLEFYGDFLFQGFRREVDDRNLFVPLFGPGGAPPPQFSNVVLRPGGTSAQSLTATGTNRPDGYQAATNEKTDTYQYAVGGAWTTERVKLSFDVARTQSRFDLSIYSFDYAFARAPTVDVDFDVPRGDGGVEFNFPGFDLTDPGNYIYRGFFDRNLIARGDDWQARADLEWQTGFDFIPTIQFGGRLTDRQGSFENAERYAPAEDQRRPLASLPVTIATTQTGFRGSDVQPQRTWASATRESIRANVAQLRQVAGFAPGLPTPDPLQAYTAQEKTYAVYGQAKYALDFGFPIDGTIGLRAVRTENQLQGTSRVIDANGESFVPTVANTAYWDYLPNASLRAGFTDQLQLRLAWSKTRTRPNFGDLNPGLIIDPPGGNSFRTARGGNPDLQPTDSTNWDASLEYYFSRTGLASVGVFRRDFTGFINNFTFFVDDPVYGSLRISRPGNGGKGRLEGLEAQVTSFFDFEFVPEPLRNFGIQANYTLLTGDQALTDEFGGLSDLRVGFNDVSKHTYNIVGLYESGLISARLAYNYRSDFPRSFEVSAGGGSIANEFTQGISRLDLSFNVTPDPRITFAIDISNILGKPFRDFRNISETERYPRDVRYEESIYSFGIRVRI